jgi:hypothetical protein
MVRQSKDTMRQDDSLSALLEAGRRPPVSAGVTIWHGCTVSGSSQPEM